MLLSDFDYHLPEELIAQKPAEKRTGSRMMVLDSQTGECELKTFADICGYINPGDCLVVNNTKVIPARLFGKRNPSGGKIECFMLEELHPGLWHCMLRPGRRMKPGDIVDINGTTECFSVEKRRDDGTFEIRFTAQNVYEILEEAGRIPLPPYIERDPTEEDIIRYQTVYARTLGAVAAPTAGLHFTDEVLAELKAKGVGLATVTLHVGPGTFKPVKTDNITDHKMHEEPYELTDEAADLINQAHENGKRVIAVGTTSVRVLETCADPETSKVVAGLGRTDIFLHPPKKPVVTDSLLTNFHLPKSTLLMLVSCFAGRENVLSAYELAVKERFRFYSYGDCMFVK